MNRNDWWQKCIEFHGHACGGLAIGFQAALYASELLGLQFSNDEQVVCIAENDACGVDAIQVILGCSVGKGNLLFHICGKQAFSFYSRKTGRSVRLCLKPKPQGLTREQALEYYQSHSAEELFDQMPVRLSLPENARIFSSILCSVCGESTAEHMIRLHEGHHVCIDCLQEYNRFDV